MMKDSVLWQHNLIDCYQNETLLPTCTNTHETTCSFTSFLSFLSLLFSPPVCVLSSEEASSTKHQGLESERKSLTELQKECTAKRWVIVNLQLSVPLFSLFHPSFSTLESSGLTSVRHYRDGPQNGALLHSALFFFLERFGRLYGQLKQTEGMLDIFMFSHPLKLHCVTISRLGCANSNGFDMTQRVTHSGLTSEIMHLYVWWCSSASCLKHSCQVSGNAVVNIAVIFVFLPLFFNRLQHSVEGKWDHKNI